MKYIALVVFIILVGVFIHTVNPCYAVEKGQSSPQEEHNKSIVLRYFKEVLDEKKVNRMPEFFDPEIQMHRPEVELSNLSNIQSIFSNVLLTQTFKTSVHDIFASGDRVVVRLSHQMTYSSKYGVLRSRIGSFDVTGKSIRWDAMAIFRFTNGKIVEEWVSRDELGMLMQVGKLELTTKHPL